jgi:hypothetical protein
LPISFCTSCPKCSNISTTLPNVIKILTFGYMNLVIIWTFDHKHYAAESASKANCHLISQDVSGTSGERKFISFFKVCKSVHHHTFQIIQPTRCNNFSSLILDVYSYVQLNMFRSSSLPSSGAQLQ